MTGPLKTNETIAPAALEQFARRMPPRGRSASWPMLRSRLSTDVPLIVVERLRNAVAGTKGATLAGVVTAAVNEFIDRLERRRGSPFPARLSRRLRAGRPAKGLTSGTGR